MKAPATGLFLCPFFTTFARPLVLRVYVVKVV